jgi:hypothetical protein
MVTATIPIFPSVLSLMAAINESVKNINCIKETYHKHRYTLDLSHLVSDNNYKHGGNAKVEVLSDTINVQSVLKLKIIKSS